VNEFIVNAKVVLFFGAGASANLGLRTMAGFRDELEARLSPDAYAQVCEAYHSIARRYRTTEDWVNLEFLMESLNEWELALFLLGAMPVPLAILPQAVQGDAFYDAMRKIVSLKHEVVRCVVQHYSSVGEIQSFRHHGWLYKLIRSGAGVVPTFTTNYDWVLEETCWGSRDKIRLTDGFSAPRGGTWSRQNFNDFRPSGDIDLILFKLHGSTSWYAQGELIIKTLDVLARAYDDSPALDPVLIFPGHKREAMISEETYYLPGDFFVPAISEREPYGCALEYLEECLSNAGLLIVIGYQFGDDEINSRMGSGLARNQHLHAIIVDPMRPLGGLAERFSGELHLDDWSSDRIIVAHEYYGNPASNRRLRTLLHKELSRIATTT